MEIASVAAGYSATANTASSASGGASRKASDPSAEALFAAVMGSVIAPDTTAFVSAAPLSEALFDTDADEARPVAPPAREREDRPRDETNAARDADAEADDVEGDAPSDRKAREADAAETDRESDQAAADGDETQPAEAQAAASGTPAAEATVAADAAAVLVATGEGQSDSVAGTAANATAQAKTQTAAAAAASAARTAAHKVGETAQPGASGSSGTGLNGGTGQQTGANTAAARAATAQTAQTGATGADAATAQTAATTTGGDAARAQADALADKVKSDTPMQVKVTVRETARPTGADQTAAATQTTANQANRPSGDLTGAAALRQQVMDGLAKAQGEGFVSNATGKGASTPSIAEQNAAAAEAKAQTAQAQAAAQACTAAQGAAAGLGQAGTDARTGEPAGVVTGGRAADAALKIDIGRASAQNQSQGQMNAQSQGSARGSAAPTAATTSGGGDSASGSGSFADQVGRAGQGQQGQAAEQARPDPQARRVVEQLRVNISKAANRGMDRITIKLHPETLGRVEVKLDFGSDGRVSAQVTVDKSETLDLLQRDVRGLERALNDAGLRTENGGIQFGLRGDGTAAQGDRGRAAAGRPGSQGHGAGGEGMADDAPPDVESIIQAAAKARGGHSVLA
ncbi:flagellar hook-length control protein FliK [Rhodospira trueperi]|uniref:Hook-length control protein FliK n=1 Tax=Rhodospira trueperi TaxID=69960 RepID=A0A1G6Z3K5_9PROT|nr:flagellar hook-length control protein FliK [Rhodospira trueperi]SDD96537.1 hook-length control protein FliK [Rhodospira trueperi]